MSSYKINPHSTEIQVVGVLPEIIISSYNIPCSTNHVFLYPGVIKHLKKRSRYGLFLTYYKHIPDVIHYPDYVGQNPREPNSIELYKKLQEDILVAIKLDPTGYLFLSTFYDLHNSSHKIKKRLRSGRIVHFSSIK